MARPGASHSASAEFPPCLQLPRVPCGMKRKASYPPRRASKIFPGALHPFPIPGQSFPGVGDNLQIWPSGETPKLLYPVFALRISGKNCMAEEAMVVLWSAVGISGSLWKSGGRSAAESGLTAEGTTQNSQRTTLMRLGERSRALRGHLLQRRSVLEVR